MLKYAHLIPFYPLIQMIRVQAEFGIMSYKKLPLLMIWFVKLIIIEPFRLIEAIVMALLPDKKIQPIFIIGYYRSGTTYLQELLSADKNHRTLNLFQSVLPEISLCFGWLFIPILSVITTLFKIKNSYHDIPFSWRFPGEEDVALNAMMTLSDYNRIYQYPSKHRIITERYLEYQNPEHANKWLENYNYLIKKLAYRYWNKKLVLKSPPNMGRINLLQKNFPEAKFIFIHRDSFESILSAKRLWKLNRAFSFEKYSETDVEDILINQYQCFYKLFKAQSGHLVCTSIAFERLINDSLGTIQLIYNKLGLKGWEKVRSEIDSINSKRKKSTNVKPAKVVPLFLQNSVSINTIRKELGYDN